MQRLLLVIDLQEAFINENIKSLINKIKDFIDKGQYNNIVFTRFINRKDSIYVKKLAWERCIDLEDLKIAVDVGKNRVINKFNYTAVNKELLEYINKNKIEEIYLCGLDTDACILKTAFDLFELGYNVYVLKDYCASSNGIEMHNDAIEILRRNIGEKYIL